MLRIGTFQAFTHLFRIFDLCLFCVQFLPQKHRLRQRFDKYSVWAVCNYSLNVSGLYLFHMLQRISSLSCATIYLPKFQSTVFPGNFAALRALNRRKTNVAVNPLPVHCRFVCNKRRPRFVPYYFDRNLIFDVLCFEITQA